MKELLGHEYGDLTAEKKDIQYGNFALGKIANHQSRANEVPKGFRKKQKNS